MTTIEDVEEMLLGVINQSCQTTYFDGKCYVHHNFIGAYEDAFYYLIDRGYLEESSNGHYLVHWERESG
jgi:hypothetical protein